ncbi:permease [Bacillus arachidis]|uniref:permease n=1 Tax=Bacillus arachidis TaxID=2819290 RepID=UPI00255C90CC|nr:permease [Bacillus arachidis]WIY63424.1 permease [Bacillus arachidis]
MFLFKEIVEKMIVVGMIPHKKKRHNRRTYGQFLSQCWVNIKIFLKMLFILGLLGAFVGFGFYIVDSISHREFTVYLALAFIICFVLSYILGHIISKVKDWNFSNADANFDGDIGGCFTNSYFISIIFIIIWYELHRL